MRHLLRALAARHDPLSDAALLERYARDRDPAAFEVLVWRHGGLVLGVCRRHLRDAHAAEDAFQATFLILARQATTVRGDTLAGFLHRVARRVAGRAAIKARRRRETPLAADPATPSPADPELAAVLDAEIDRLPDRLRQVVVLCYLDGRSTEDAASRLGVPRGTVLSRLHTARAKLQVRLTRRGVTPPAVGLATVLTAEMVAGGVRAAGGGVGAVTTLANEVLTMSVRKTVLAVAAGLVLAGGAGTGVGVLSAQSGKPPAGDKPTAAPPRPDAKPDDREERGRRLAVAEAKLADRLQAAQERVRKLNHQIGTQVDVAALQARLVALDVEILAAEDKAESERAALDRLKREEGIAASAPLDERRVEQYLTHELRALTAEKQELESRSRSRLSRGTPDAAAEAKRQIEEIDAKLAKRRAELRPTVEKRAREERVREREAHVQQTTYQIELTQAEVTRLAARRGRLVERIGAQRELSDARRLAEDEARVYHELRMAVVRQRLQLELGVEIPNGQTAADATAERFDHLARQLADLKAALLTPDGGSRLDAIEKQLKEQRPAPGGLQ